MAKVIKISEVSRERYTPKRAIYGGIFPWATSRLYIYSKQAELYFATKPAMNYVF